MAETAKPTPNPVVPPPAAEAPVQAPVAPPSKAELAWKNFRKAASGFMTMTFWLALGGGLIVFGFLEHKLRVTHHLPQFLDFFTQTFRHFFRIPYLSVGLGLACLGVARGFVFREYSAEVRKNKKSPHRWKVPLIGTQIALFYVGSFYALGVAVQKIQPIQNMLALTFLLFFGIGYALWYLLGWLKNHFETLASARVAAVALILGALSYGFWALSHQIALSLMMAFYALIAALFSVSITLSKGPEQRLAWSRTICLLGTMVLVFFVAKNALPIGKPTADLRGMVLALGDPQGEVGNIVYGPRVHAQKAKDKLTQKLAFSLKGKEGWFLQIVDPENQTLPTFKVAAGEGPFKPLFIEEGKYLILDPVKNGARALWRVDSGTGEILVLKSSGVDPFGNGVPWHPGNRQLLFVTQKDGNYRLNLWSAGTGVFRLIMTSSAPILTPSFTFDGKGVVYADGVTGYFRIRDLKTGETDFLQSQQERSERRMEGLPPVSEVIPAPDGFRYLYTTQADGKTSFWAVLSDGGKRNLIHRPVGSVRNLSWTPDGQKIVFEETKRHLGFLLPSTNIMVLDANLGSWETLIAPQLDHRVPAVSPDGAKLAFVASQGLWYPISGVGIWVALLR